MSYDAIQAKRARWGSLGSGLEPGETPEWDVTAMYLELGMGPDNEGFLAFTDRRLFFVPDYDQSPARMAMISYQDVSAIKRERGPMRSACATVALGTGETFHFVTGKRSVKLLEKLVRTYQKAHG